MASLPAYLIAYDVLSFLSALVIAATILTVICSNQLHRGRAWFGMMSCWLVYAISYGILVGKQTGSEPTFAHCFVQTMLIYAAPSLVAVGVLCFYLDFYLGICWDATHRRPLQPRIANLLLALPWIVHFAIDIEVAIVKLTFRSDAEIILEKIESNLYCHLRDNSIPALVNATIVVLSMALLIPLEVWTGIQLYKRRTIHAHADFRKYLAAYIRIAACTIVASTAFGLSVITITDVKGDSKVQDLSFPCLSMAVSLIFASQKDLLNVWLCRRRRPLLSSSSELVRSVDQKRPEELKTLRAKSTWNSDSSDITKHHPIFPDRG